MADGSMVPQLTSVMEFMKLVPGGRDPKRADRSGAGSLPGRATENSVAVEPGMKSFAATPVPSRSKYNASVKWLTAALAAAYAPTRAAAERVPIDDTLTTSPLPR